MLGRHIGRCARKADRTEYRGEIHNDAFAPAHCRNLGAHTVENATQINRNRALPRCYREPCGGLLGRLNPGVIHGPIERAEVPKRFLHQRFGILGASDIATQRVGFAPSRHNAFSRRFCRRQVQITDHHAGTRLR